MGNPSSGSDAPMTRKTRKSKDPANIVAKLVTMGFDESAASAALKKTGGDVQAAVNELVRQSKVEETAGGGEDKSKKRPVERPVSDAESAVKKPREEPKEAMNTVKEVDGDTGVDTASSPDSKTKDKKQKKEKKEGKDKKDKKDKKETKDKKAKRDKNDREDEKPVEKKTDSKEVEEPKISETEKVVVKKSPSEAELSAAMPEPHTPPPPEKQLEVCEETKPDQRNLNPESMKAFFDPNTYHKEKAADANGKMQDMERTATLASIHLGPETPVKAPAPRPEIAAELSSESPNSASTPGTKPSLSAAPTPSPSPSSTEAKA